MLATHLRGMLEVELHQPLHEREREKGAEQHLVCLGTDPAQSHVTKRYVRFAY